MAGPLFALFVLLLQVCPAFRPSSSLETKVFCNRLMCSGSSLHANAQGLLAVDNLLASDAAFSFLAVYIVDVDELPDHLINCEKLLTGTTALITDGPLCCHVFVWHVRCGKWPPTETSPYKCTLTSPPCRNTSKEVVDTTTATTATTTATTTARVPSFFSSTNRHIPGAAGARTIARATTTTATTVSSTADDNDTIVAPLTTSTVDGGNGGGGGRPAEFYVTISIPAVLGGLMLTAGVVFCCCCKRKGGGGGNDADGRAGGSHEMTTSFTNPNYRPDQLPPALPDTFLAMQRAVQTEARREDDRLSNSTTNSSCSGNSDLLWTRGNDGGPTTARGSTKAGLQMRKLQ